MTKEELKQILEQYKLWLDDLTKGSRADLREDSLYMDDLISALIAPDLRQPNLKGADLRWANLRGADLREANLRGADLRYADPTDTILNKG